MLSPPNPLSGFPSTQAPPPPSHFRVSVPRSLFSNPKAGNCIKYIFVAAGDLETSHQATRNLLADPVQVFLDTKLNTTLDMDVGSPSCECFIVIREIVIEFEWLSLVLLAVAFVLPIRIFYFSERG